MVNIETKTIYNGGVEEKTTIERKQCHVEEDVD